MFNKKFLEGKGLPYPKWLWVLEFNNKRL
jgi:hypothetical protein